MQHSLMLLGDINLMGVRDWQRPFAQVRSVLRGADVVFANLECCFYSMQQERSVDAEGFFAEPASAQALPDTGIHVVGNANNVNYGAAAIRASLENLDAVNVAYTGAGRDATEAIRPVLLERDGIRCGFIQRTSVFWNHGHRATDDTPGVATLAGHTAYRPRLEDTRTLTRPGSPPEILTWADPAGLAQLRADIEALRPRCDILVASHHWGYGPEVLGYQREIAHAAIDAGADIVFGHGPHLCLPVEWFAGKPIFYGAGSFSFETGHRAIKHPDWLGYMTQLVVSDGRIETAHLQFVRHNADNETVLRSAVQESEACEDLRARSLQLGAALSVAADRIQITSA